MGRESTHAAKPGSLTSLFHLPGKTLGRAGKISRTLPEGAQAHSGVLASNYETSTVLKARVRKCTPGLLPEVPELHGHPIIWFSQMANPHIP